MHTERGKTESKYRNVAMIAMVTDWGKESGFKEPLQGRRKGGLKK
jgi:hypothetical protein